MAQDKAFSGWIEAAAGAARLGAGRVLDLLYPPVCAACEEAAAEPGGLCGPCWRDTPWITGAACDRCGAPLAFDEAAMGPTLAAASGGVGICESCLRHPPRWTCGRAAVVYAGAARALVLALKHGDRLDAARLMGRWMARAGADLWPRVDVVVPVPLHWTRRLTRRQNQAAELARAALIAAEDGPAPAFSADARPKLAASALTRRRATPRQEGLDRSARRANVDDAFIVPRRWRRRLSGRGVLLIDDVMTTGATLSAAADALRAGGAADVHALVFARVCAAEPAPISSGRGGLEGGWRERPVSSAARAGAD